MEMNDFFFRSLLSILKTNFIYNFNELVEVFRKLITKVEENEQERIIQIFILIITNEVTIRFSKMEYIKERMPLFLISNKTEFDEKLKNSVFFTIDNQMAGYELLDGMLVAGQMLDQSKMHKIYHKYKS